MKLFAAVIAAAIPALGLAAPTLEVLHTFDDTLRHLGAGPIGQIILAPDGTLTGATMANLSPDDGTVWRLTPAPGRLHDRVLWQFTRSEVGNDPLGGVTAGPNGSVFGTTAFNGVAIPSGCGAVYQLRQSGQSWTATALWHPPLLRPGSPCSFYGPVTTAPDGSLYGTTSSGGDAGFGAIWRLRPPLPGHTHWRPETLYSFTGKADGYYSSSPVLLGRDGALYGTAIGSANQGPSKTPIWRLTPPADGSASWGFDLIWRFADAECVEVSGPLIQDASGAVTGTCQEGVRGEPGQFGQVFRLTPPAQRQLGWTVQTLWRFTGGADGGFPSTGVTPDASGTLYGAMDLHQGGIFALSPPASPGAPWTERVLHSFDGASEGAKPESPLVLGPDGTLYGTNSLGGAGRSGTVFALHP